MMRLRHATTRQLALELRGPVRDDTARPPCGPRGTTGLMCRSAAAGAQPRASSGCLKLRGQVCDDSEQRSMLPVQQKSTSAGVEPAIFSFGG